MMFKKILVANRSEIALRAVRECREMGIGSVAVYSDADAEALFVKHADEAYPLGDPEPAASYLNVEKILDIARQSGAEAIYPGYGFLAENPKFVEECEARGIEFIGPPSKSMNAAKPKHKSRDLMKSNGIPVTHGSDGAIEDESGMAKAFEIAEGIGYPVIVKPSGAGGGIGMKVANSKDELAAAMEYARSLGSEAFGVPAFYLEKYISRAKHIEFQILADKKGNVVYVSDRECSVQRRYQKLIEEAPSPIMTPELRQKMGATAVQIAKLLNYVNALTVEFIYSMDDKEYYFNECNTRLQVEHPLTELLTGINLVKEQIRIAAGEELGYGQDDIKLNGWSIECRINAEDPFMNFMPAPGTITAYDPPGGFGVRVDGGVYAGYAMPFYYDSLIAKLLSWGRNRDEAIATMKRAVQEYRIEGAKTNIPFHIVALDDECFRNGDYTTHFIQEQGISKKLRQLKKEGVFS
ncbi:MAG: acetyl-CoA carboxylase biotin carboxylase subunit [Dehalococcoidia bacterium]|nr:acetyl-CoA carboxylase biotin carboxylase subunit [Dehalococcoidia bacterium]